MKKYATKKDATLEHIAEQTSVRWTQFLTIPSHLYSTTVLHPSQMTRFKRLNRRIFLLD